MATTTATMRTRFPLLLLILFLASVSVTYGALAYWEKDNPCQNKCLQSCNAENDVNRHEACLARCNQARRCRPQQGEEQEGEDEDEDEEVQTPRRRQQHGHRPQWREDEEQGQRQPGRQWQSEERHRQRRREQRGEEEEEDEGEGEGEDEEEDEYPPSPWGQRRQEQERRRREQRRQEKQRRRQRQTEEDEEQEWRGSRGSRHQIQRRGSRQSQRSSSRNNPFYFPRSRFQTLYRNEHGRIRLLQRFDRRSDKLENLQNYRIVEIETRPNTLVLPKHADAESLLVIQEGEAVVHLANADDRDSYNLERGDALRIPAGTISYIVNRNDNQNLRIAKLVIPVNQPGKFDDFFPATNQDQQSYFEGFSTRTLEASFNAPFSEIQRTLLQDTEREEARPRRHESEEEEEDEGVIVKLSREQIQELSKHAKSSRKRGSSSESGAFSLRSRKPIHENNYGRFFELTPNKNNPQLQDLGIYLTWLDIREGGLLLPHFNSKAILVIAVGQGRGNLELVALREQNQRQRKQWQREQEDEDEEEEEEEDEEEEGNKQVHRYTARLSRGDIVTIPAGYPFAINASSDLHLLGFGINAENNQRNFLAGVNDNVLNQIHEKVKELAFPGSGEEVQRLFKNQRGSYFVSAQPQQQEREGRRQGRKGPLSSILSAFY